MEFQYSVGSAPLYFGMGHLLYVFDAHSRAEYLARYQFSQLCGSNTDSTVQPNRHLALLSIPRALSVPECKLDRSMNRVLIKDMIYNISIVKFRVS